MLNTSLGYYAFDDKSKNYKYRDLDGHHALMSRQASHIADKGIYEIKSIAVYPEYQRQGYGRQLIAFVLEHYKDRCHTVTFVLLSSSDR